MQKILKLLLKMKWSRKLFGRAFLQHTVKKWEFPDWINRQELTDLGDMISQYHTWQNSKFSFITTELIDGETAIYAMTRTENKKPKYVVCSKNLKRPYKEDGHSQWWMISRYSNMETVLKNIMDDNKVNTVILYGVIIGPDINNNQYNKQQYKFYATSLLVDTYQFDYINMVEELYRYGIACVPQIDIDMALPPSVVDIVDYAVRRSDINPEVEQKGVVARLGNKSFKVLNQNFMKEVKKR